MFPIALLLLVAFGGAPRRAHADVNPRVVVSGRVIDDRVGPVVGALVVLTSPGTGRVRSTRTNELGEYTFGVVDDDGRFDVLVRRIGFIPARFTLGRRIGDEPLVGNVQLEPIRQSFAA